MAEVLTGPFLAAAIVLLAAAVAKLRAPGAAVRALEALGLPGSRAAVYALSAGEAVLATACVVSPGRWTAGALACAYCVFAAAALVLARRRSACGCFGVEEEPASVLQAIVSGVLSLLAVWVAASGAHGAAWVSSRPLGSAVVLLVGITGSAYAIVLIYTALPRAWSSWRAT